MAVIVPLALVFGVLVGAVSRAIAGGPTRGWSGVVGRAAVAIAVGTVVGELAAVVLFSGSIDRLLDERAARSADSTPAVAQASADLDRTRQARTALDSAVDDAGRQRDEALVIARCEYNPSPACPLTHITGVPGAGPETRTATDFLADTQRQLDNAVANRDRVAPRVDSEIAAREQALEQTRTTAMKDVDHGLGARWMAMNDHTFASKDAMLLRLVTIVFFALLILLPLILKLWRGQTSQDRGAAARAEVEHAELEADTAIAVKRAEVRASVETLWAEQQLASARLAVEAQTGNRPRATAPQGDGGARGAGAGAIGAGSRADARAARSRIGQPASTGRRRRRGAAPRGHLAHPNHPGRHQGCRAVASPVRAADHRERDRHHDQAAA